MKTLHYSYDAREQGKTGGVPKFGWYLQKAIGCEIYYVDGKQPPKSYMSDYVAITDGEWGAFFHEKQPMISVVHGIWKELHSRCGMTDGPEVAKQNYIWTNRLSVPRVASSPAVARELKKHHGVNASTTIMHGVDMDLFVPRPRSKPLPKVPVVIHCATDFIKHAKEVRELAKSIKQFDIQFLDAKVGEEPGRFAQGDIFLHWSKYEGCSYAMIEALAAGLPIVGTAVGAFEEEIIRQEAGVFAPWHTEDAGTILSMLTQVAENYTKFNPRDVAETFFNYENFKYSWEHFIERSFR